MSCLGKWPNSSDTQWTNALLGLLGGRFLKSTQVFTPRLRHQPQSAHHYIRDKPHDKTMIHQGRHLARRFSDSNDSIVSSWPLMRLPGSVGLLWRFRSLRLWQSHGGTWLSRAVRSLFWAGVGLHSSAIMLIRFFHTFHQMTPRMGNGCGPHQRWVQFIES